MFLQPWQDPMAFSELGVGVDAIGVSRPFPIENLSRR